MDRDVHSAFMDKVQASLTKKWSEESLIRQEFLNQFKRIGINK